MQANMKDVSAVAEARYMTLKSVMDLVPEHARSTVKIYRIKPPNRYNTMGQVEYKRKRYVVIFRNGFDLCTCLLGRHTGIPCSHFFAVLRHRTEHSFNIAQINQRWHNPLDLASSCSRPWVSLQTEPQEISNVDEVVTEPSWPPADLEVVNRTETEKQMEQQAHLEMTPRQHRIHDSAKKRIHREITNLTDEIMKHNSPTRQINFRNRLAAAFKEIQEENRVANYHEPTVETSPHPELDKTEGETTDSRPTENPLDPLPYPKKGRKQTKRIAASMEGRIIKKRKHNRKK